MPRLPTSVFVTKSEYVIPVQPRLESPVYPTLLLNHNDGNRLLELELGSPVPTNMR